MAQTAKSVTVTVKLDAVECCEVRWSPEDYATHRAVHHPLPPLQLRGEESLGEAQCCYLACDGGGCETCPCCCAGWCVFSQDGVPEPGSEDEERWLEIRTLTAQGGFR